MSKKLEKLAEEIRKEYFRKWRSENKDRIKKNAADYWKRKAEQKLKEEGDE